MDFTPPSNSNPPPIHANPISSIPSSRKLPIKRKTPSSNSTLILSFPPDVTHPPFKFHRVWSEPDEIRLLQGLLDCSSQGLSFPRDLAIFYAQFSNKMSQPYSRTQLSEKLRRLRKKFRVITSRLDKGMDKALLSDQDRALYDLSKQLWGLEAETDHPSVLVDDKDVNCKPHDIINENCKTSMAGERVEVPSSAMAVLALPTVVKKPNSRGNGSEKYDNVDSGLKDSSDRSDVGLEGGVKLGSKEVGVGDLGDELSSGIVRFVSRTLADVVDESLEKMRSRMGMMVEVGRFSDEEKEVRFEKRWRDQCVAEFDVLAKRLKLIVEGCSMGGK